MRRSSQLTLVASKSGPSTQANLVSPSISTRQQPHMPVPSTMIGLSEATMGVSYFIAVRVEKFTIGPGPTQKPWLAALSGGRRSKGVVTAPLERLLQDKAVSQVFCVGPVPMMKFSTLTAQKYDTPITASLNPIMVDGTGMCGCCRVEVGGVTKVACVDGPDFDATLVDWDDLRARQAAYRSEEGESLKAYEEKSCACH